MLAVEQRTGHRYLGFTKGAGRGAHFGLVTAENLQVAGQAASKPHLHIVVETTAIQGHQIATLGGAGLRLQVVDFDLRQHGHRALAQVVQTLVNALDSHGQAGTDAAQLQVRHIHTQFSVADALNLLRLQAGFAQPYRKLLRRHAKTATFYQSGFATSGMEVMQTRRVVHHALHLADQRTNAGAPLQLQHKGLAQGMAG